MNDADLTVHVLERLWWLGKQAGIEELLFCYAKMQKLSGLTERGT
jgi:hypothetical protein